MNVAALPVSAQAQAAAYNPVPAAQLAENRELIQAVKSLNAAGVFAPEGELSFQIDRETRRVVMRIVDKQTHEVIRQVPPEYVLQLARSFLKSHDTAGA